MKYQLRPYDKTHNYPVDLCGDKNRDAILIVNDNPIKNLNEIIASRKKNGSEYLGCKWADGDDFGGSTNLVAFFTRS